MRVFLIDNFDSFTFNLVQYLGELGAKVTVRRSDQVDLNRLESQPPDRLVISPGPGRPEDASVSVATIQRFGSQIPTLGVCLGHQSIVVAYGGKVDRAPEPRHGKTSVIRHDNQGIFKGISNPFEATRYHSLAALELPTDLEPCAWSEDEIIQGIRHRQQPVTGVQFHPESIMTKVGHQLLDRFLQG